MRSHVNRHSKIGLLFRVLFVLQISHPKSTDTHDLAGPLHVFGEGFAASERLEDTLLVGLDACEVRECRHLQIKRT